MLLGLAQFLWGQKYLHGHAEPPRPLARSTEWKIYAGGIAGLLPVAGLMWAVANRAFSLGAKSRWRWPDAPGDARRAGLVRLVRHHPVQQVQRQQMISLITLIFMCLVFFTLYEQTYGSWVTFTDRLMTKDIMPSMVQAQCAVAWTDDGRRIRLVRPHRAVVDRSLLLAPGSFVLAASLSDATRHPGAEVLFAGAFALMLDSWSATASCCRRRAAR